MTIEVSQETYDEIHSRLLDTYQGHTLEHIMVNGQLLVRADHVAGCDALDPVWGSTACTCARLKRQRQAPPVFQSPWVDIWWSVLATSAVIAVLTLAAWYFRRG